MHLRCAQKDRKTFRPQLTDSLSQFENGEKWVQDL